MYAHNKIKIRRFTWFLEKFAKQRNLLQIISIKIIIKILKCIFMPQKG